MAKPTESDMTNRLRSDEHVGELLSGLIDGELTQQERQRVRLHCETCGQCRRELTELEALRKRVGESRLSEVSHDIWREKMNDTTVKATRGIGWLLLIAGVLIAAGLALYEFVLEIGSIPPTVLMIIGGVYGGLILLFFSVLRQRLIERKTDKYDDVEI